MLAETEGALDDTAGDAFHQHLLPLVNRGGTRLILDISQSPRINSAGIACLVRLFGDARAAGSCVVLAAPTPFVANVLTVTRLNTYFEVVGDVAEAKSRLSRL